MDQEPTLATSSAPSLIPDISIGDYVKVVEDNEENHRRYNGKFGTITAISTQPRITEIHNTETEETISQVLEETLYVVEIDNSTGDQGTCIARKVELAQKGGNNNDGQ